MELYKLKPGTEFYIPDGKNELLGPFRLLAIDGMYAQVEAANEEGEQFFHRDPPGNTDPALVYFGTDVIVKGEGNGDD